MIKIYGTRMSRANRCMWLLEELGLSYEQVPVAAADGSTRTPAYLALNASGKVPVLDDDGFVLRETIAICLYLAAKAPTPLWPDDPRTRARIHQWISWAATELEAPLSIIFTDSRRLKGAPLDPDFKEARLSTARNALDLLEGHLAGNPYVASDDFTLGDLMACATVGLAPMFIALDPYPAIREWMGRCNARPSWQRAETRQ